MAQEQEPKKETQQGNTYHTRNNTHRRYHIRDKRIYLLRQAR